MTTKQRSKTSRGATKFLNVDLEIETSAGRELLVEELGRRMFEMHDDGRMASFETLSLTKTLDATLRALVRTLNKLSPAAKRAWMTANRRDFNIGIQAGTLPRTVELPIESKTVEQIAKLGGRVVVTIYAVEQRRRTQPRQPRRAKVS